MISPGVVVAVWLWQPLAQLAPSPGEPVLPEGAPPGYISEKLLNNIKAVTAKTKGRSLIFICYWFICGWFLVIMRGVKLYKRMYAAHIGCNLDLINIRSVCNTLSV